METVVDGGNSVVYVWSRRCACQTREVRTISFSILPMLVGHERVSHIVREDSRMNRK